MMRPGKIFINASLRLETKFFDDNGDDTDPVSVTCMVTDPYGTTTTYTYGTDDELGKSSTGDFYLDITPDSSGRWFYRWKGTDSTTTVADEGDFRVQYSPHYEGMRSRY